MSENNNVGMLILFLLFGIVYIFPSIIAFFRRHPNRWLILVINIASGITVFGWLLTLIWALQAIHKSPLTAIGKGTDGGESGLNPFVNDQTPMVIDYGMSIEARLWRLQMLFDKGTISREEFNSLKRQVIEA